MRNPETRIYGTTLAQPFHTDISDIVGKCWQGQQPQCALHCDITLCNVCFGVSLACPVLPLAVKWHFRVFSVWSRPCLSACCLLALQTPASGLVC